MTACWRGGSNCRQLDGCGDTRSGARRDRAERLAKVGKGITIDGVSYGPIRAELERVQGSNAWIAMALREGKNREVRRVLEHLGLQVTRLIRLSYGPFQLGNLARGAVDEVPKKVLAEQLGGAHQLPQMRIVAGKHSRPPAVSSAGRERLGRPAIAPAEALFNVLSHGESPPAASRLPTRWCSMRLPGTGALGLEALSRGAAEAVFIEQDREALSILRKNIAALDEGARTRVIPGDATRPPRACSGCAVAFLDPPYAAARRAGACRAGGRRMVSHRGRSPSSSWRRASNWHRRPGSTILDERNTGRAACVSPTLRRLVPSGPYGPQNGGSTKATRRCRGSEEVSEQDRPGIPGPNCRA